MTGIDQDSFLSANTSNTSNSNRLRLGQPVHVAASSPRHSPSRSKPKPQRPKKSDDKIQVMITNCNSLFGKKEAFAETVKSSNPHVILVTETWLKPDIGNSECIPDNYTAYRKDRLGRTGGGVLIAVRNDIITTHLEYLDVDAELIWISLQMVNSKPIHICCFYRPPNQGITPIQRLRESLSKIDWKKNPHVWVGGDFNVPDINWEIPCRKPSLNCNYPAELTTELLTLLEDFSLTQLALEPNHNFQTRSVSVQNILNLLCVSNPSSFSALQTEPGISDHFKLVVEAEIRPIIQKNVRRKVYLWHKADENSLKSELRHFGKTFEENCNKLSVEQNWNKFVQALQELVNKNVPSTLKSTRFNLPWLTRPLKRLIRRKNRAFYTAKTTRSTRQWERYRNLRKQVQQDLRKAEQDYLSTTVFDSLQTNVKKFWSFIKHRRQDACGISALKVNGSLFNEARDKAEILSKQYQSVFTKDDASNVPSLGISPYPAVDDLFVSSEGVLKLLKGLNINKAPGPDGIYPQVLKMCADEIAPILQIIYNQSISTGKLPKDWRKANISPIFKRGSRSDAANYRPVSLTSISCKLLEHIIYHHIVNHLENFDILCEHQHGFRPRRSCETQLLSTVHHIFDGVDKTKQVDAIILDFEKAFDVVSHKRLLHKLKHYGIRNSLLPWISDFLTNREQSVVIQGRSSNPVHVDSGVPQGTVLGPLLFLCYINDLPDNITSKVCLFADDCLIYSPVKDQKDCRNLQTDLNKLAKWGKKWQMKFKPTKCNIMRFTRKKSPITFNYTLSGQSLPETSHHKYLGVTLSSDMRWNRHVDTVSAKANSIIGFIRRNLSNAPVNVKTQAYKSLVRPHVEYCSSVWNPHTKRNKDKIEAVQRRAARVISNDHGRTSSVTSMMERLKLPPLQNRRQYSSLVMFQKITFNHVDLNIKEFIHMQEAPLARTRMTTRSTKPNQFAIPQSNSQPHLYSFFPNTARIWNSLPEEITSVENVNKFSSALQKNMQLV